MCIRKEEVTWGVWQVWLAEMLVDVGLVPGTCGPPWKRIPLEDLVPVTEGAWLQAV